MAVLITAEVPGQTQEGYDGLLKALGSEIRSAKGFIAHFGAPAPGGWRCMELWETEHDANQFFARHVHPHLPPGIKPQRSFQELHSLIKT